jgi:hypothetical protein
MKVLPVIVPPAPPPPFIATAAPVRFGDGFYDEEGPAGERFRWMRERSVMAFEPQAASRFLELRVL